MWRCKKCGRTGDYKFFEHATSKDVNDFCYGNVVRVRKEDYPRRE